MVPHKYMGPLPAFFYPEFQLVDYAVHNWDIRQGTGRAHAISGDAADLLVPLCLVLWSATSTCGPDTPATELGVRVTSGHNAGDTRLTAGTGGVAYEPGAIDGLPTVLEFDPASFVLTAYGRINGGTARGDQAVADRFLNLFFRIQEDPCPSPAGHQIRTRAHQAGLPAARGRTPRQQRPRRPPHCAAVLGRRADGAVLPGPAGVLRLISRRE